MNISELTLLNNIASAEHNIIRNAGALEPFIRNAYCGCFNDSIIEKERKWNEVFSHLGEKNNPPDYMVALGSAGEIKSLASLAISSHIQFNSSFPLKKLTVVNPRITKACIQSERWTEKPMIYVIGHVVGRTLVGLVVISGKFLFTPTTEILADRITTSINSIDDISVSETTELARINDIGHYNNISLRVRGMWLVVHPLRTFQNIFEITRFNSNLCSICALLDGELYDAISSEEKHMADSLEFQTVQHDIPDNTGRVIRAVAIRKNIELGGNGD